MRLVAFTRGPGDLDAAWLQLLSERGGVSAVLVCHQVRGTRRRPMGAQPPESSSTTPAAPTVDWLWCGAASSHALESEVRSWRPDAALVLEPPPAAIAIATLSPSGVVVVDPPTRAMSHAAAAAMAGGAGWIGVTANAQHQDMASHDVVAVRAPIYGDDRVRDVGTRLEELRRIAAVQALGVAARGDRVPNAAATQPPRGRATLPTRLWLRIRPVADAIRSLARPRRLAKDALTLAAIGVIRPMRDALRTLRGTHPVRIFTFHRVTSICRDKTSISPETFRRRIAYVARHHDVVDLETALAAIEQKRRLRRPLAVITFDDAYRSVFDHARPILAERGLTACCFATTGLVGTDDRFAHDAASPVRSLLQVMDWSELAALRSLGWGIGAHTATHRRLSTCSPDDYVREIAAPFAELRDRLGLEQVAIAYPFGERTDIDTPALAAVVQAGYRACLSNYGGENFPGDQLFELKRFDIGGTHEPLSWRARVHGIDLGVLRRRSRRPAARADHSPVGGRS